MVASHRLPTLLLQMAARRQRGIAILTTVLLAVSAPAMAQQAQTASEARVIVSGEGNVNVAPDYARIRSGVTTRAKTAREAADTNAKTMAAVTAALVNAGIAQNDIKTSRFSVQPVYAAPQPNTEPKLSGFSVSNQVSVTVRQVDTVGDILDRLISAGATDVGGIEFLHSDVSRLLDRAREAAIADARRKAELYARAAGVKLGGVLFISEDGASTPFAPVKAMRVAAAPTPIAAGEDTLRVSVSVGFDLAH